MARQAGSLAGRRVVVTRTQEGAATFAARLRALGAQVEEVPLLKFAPPESWIPLDDTLARLADYDMLLVTSATTVRMMHERRPGPWHDQPWTAAIGPATAEALHTVGLRVDLVPPAAVGESLLEALATQAAGRRVLLPRAESARDVLPDGLRAAGASVEIVCAYRTVPEETSAARLRTLFAPGSRQVDFVTFTSGSTVEHFFSLLGAEQASAALRQSLACSIGPVTSSTLRRHQVARVAEAAQHDLGGLVELLGQQAAHATES